MLAVEFMRLALIRIAVDPLTTEAIEASILLADEALKLDPDNVEIWRHLLDMAILGERDEAKSRALEAITRLDPHDQRVRLMRLTTAIERFQTAEERINAYLQLLEPANLERMDGAVSSRLALELALLYQRLNNNERFTHWLKESIAMDSSNRSAAAIAAGFFRMHVNNPAGEAELLVNLMLADPTDLTTQVALAQLLLEHGAYDGADRMYALAINGFTKAGAAPSNNLLADAAVAQWAHGADAVAAETIRKRLSEWDEVARMAARQRNPDLDTPQLAEVASPVDPVLASVQAVIETGRDPARAAEWVDRAMAAYEERIKFLQTAEGQQSSGLTPERTELHVASLRLEMAWLSTWLGGPADRTAELLASVDQQQQLSDEARARFEGWIALRRGDVDGALERLEPLATADVAARAGLGLARLQAGQSKAAAQDFLAVNRAQPGSLLGIWAARELHKILGTRLPLSDDAKAMEQLIKSIPGSYDRAPNDSSMAVALHVRPAKPSFEPFEPVRIIVEVVNHSARPLALDRDGPIRPQVLMAPRFRSTAAPGLEQVRPFIVNIGRKLRLMPGERVQTTFDFRLQPAAEVLNALSIDGCLVRMSAQLNFTVLQNGSSEPALYGSEVEVPMIRVDGQRVGEDWLNNVIAVMGRSGGDDAALVREMALMSNRIAPRISADATLKVRRTIEQARIAFDGAFRRLGPRAQAWLLCVMPTGEGPAVEGLAAVRDAARQSTDRLVQLAYLMFHSAGTDDPMFDAAKRSDDPQLRRLAELIQIDNARIERQQQDQQGR